MSGGRNHGFARGVKRAGGAGALIAALVVSARLTSSSGLPDTPVWLGWFSLLPLFLALRLGSPVTAFWAGVLWGISLHLFSCAEPLVLSCSGLGALLLRALVPAGYAYLGCRLARALGFNPLVLGVGWMGGGAGAGALGGAERSAGRDHGARHGVALGCGRPRLRAGGVCGRAGHGLVRFVAGRAALVFSGCPDAPSFDPMRVAACAADLLLCSVLCTATVAASGSAAHELIRERKEE